MTVSRNDISWKLATAMCKADGYDDQDGSEVEAFTHLSDAALTALSEFVIFLPEDAKPEVGDLVEGAMTNMGGWYVGHITGLDKDTGGVYVMDEDYIESCKIIQRSGKPVITIKSEANNG